MLNVNTGYKFDPNNSVGSTQLDINLMALSWRPNNPFFPYDPNAEGTLLLARNPSNLSNYENNVIWQHGTPNGAYTPFDISDELEMRYRFVIDQENIHTRLESWGNQLCNLLHPSILWTPFDNSSNANVPNNWVTHTYDNGSLDPNYSYRHIATTYNCDRIINPAGHKMVNVNTASKEEILVALQAGLSETIPGDINGLAAQITANLIDYRDEDSNVTVVDVNTSSGGTAPYYGFETPCIYISEIAESIIHYGSPPNDSNASSFAIELYKPYYSDPFPASPVTDPCHSWRLWIDKGATIPPIPINWSGSQRFHVIASINALAPIDVNTFDVNGPNEPNNPFAQEVNYISLSGGESMELQRYVPEVNSFITVDFVWVPEPNSSVGWLQPIDINSAEEKLDSWISEIWGWVQIRQTYQRKTHRDWRRPVERRLWDFRIPTIGTINP